MHIPQRMRVLLAAILLVFAQDSIAQTRAVKTLERVTVSNVTYASLLDWARMCGLNSRFDRKAGVLELSGRGSRLIFTADSRRAQINGVSVMLSMPITPRAGGLLVSVVDLNTTLQPILFPYRNAGKARVNTICLDPGHGGRDTGKIDKSHYEKKYTLLLAQEIASLLKPQNVKVVFTRTRDQTLELSDRAASAKRQGADLFLSLHYNAAANRSVRGLEVYCMTPQGFASSNEGGGKGSRAAYMGNLQNSQNMLLAHVLHKSILGATGLEDRGLKRSRFEVLREARMPAVLIEGGFMTNPLDAQRIYDPNFRKKTAQGIVDGILAYKRIVER